MLNIYFLDEFLNYEAAIQKFIVLSTMSCPMAELPYLTVEEQAVWDIHELVLSV